MPVLQGLGRPPHHLRQLLVLLLAALLLLLLLLLLHGANRVSCHRLLCQWAEP